MEMILTAVLVSGLTLALGFVLGRFVWPAPRPKDAAEQAHAKSEIERLENTIADLKGREVGVRTLFEDRTATLQERDLECARLSERLVSLSGQCDAHLTSATAARAALDLATAELTRLTESATRHEERSRTLQTQVTTLSTELADANETLNEERRRAGESAEQIVRLTERSDALTRELAEIKAQQSTLQENLKSEFENIATKVLRANSMELSESSQKQIATILDPLRERIAEFQGKVETTYEAEKREVISLKEQIRLIAEASQNLGSQADGLAKALKGDVQKLGRWGELVLDRILQSAGLQEGREYTTQGRGLKLKSETGSRQKPDVIIHLPDDRCMIIDSKTPLAAYDRLVAALEPEERAVFTRQFLKDIRGHIDDLSGQQYQDNEKIVAHDVVLMFVPIEGALAAALTADPELFTYGWNKRVVVVGPPTLLMTLKTVASIWRYEHQAANAQEIARLAGAMCDKIGASLGDFNRTAERLADAVSTHNAAIKRLTTGKGNALSFGERIKALGVHTKTPMPTMLVDDDYSGGEEDADAPPSDRQEKDSA